jgi:transcriptional regulator with XRE-family HTH domain
MKNISRTLLLLRLDAKLNRKEFAKKIGVTAHTVGRIELGDQRPGLSYLDKVAVLLNKELEITFKNK